MDSVFVVDVANILWRYYHTQPQELLPEHRAAGAVDTLTQGLPRWEQRARQALQASRLAVVFAFEGGLGQRRALCPEYKVRAPGNEAPATAVRGVMRDFQKRLRGMGYRNLFRVAGYEADDVVAADVEQWTGTTCILSSDKDMNQLLSSRTMIWRPADRAPYTIDDFRAQYNVEPWQWVELRAIAGDPSDGIVGVRGCGTKTAAKWLRGELKPSSAAHQMILDQVGTVAANMQLIRLPVDAGCRVPDIRQDKTGTPAGVKPRRGGNGFGLEG